MKKNRTTRLVVLVLFLAIVTAVIISGTFAKYTETTAPVSSTAQVAKWSFSADGLDSFARTDSVSAEMIAEDQLAPGTKGTIGAVLNFTGCEVAVDYVVEISNVQNKPTNLKFLNGSEEITAVDGKYTVTGSLTVSEIAALTDGDHPVTINWEWPYETTDGDSIDTTEGKAAVDMTFDIAITATQANPNA